MLCQRCITTTSNILSIFSHAGQNEDVHSCMERELEHGNLLGLISSANGGCAPCQLFLGILGVETLQRIIAQAKEWPLKGRRIIICVQPLDVGEFHVKMPSFIGTPVSSASYGLGRFEFYRLAPFAVGIGAGGSSMTKCILTRVNDKPDSPEAFNLARSWIYDCTRNHGRCTRPSKAILPPRLIDVGQQTGPQEPCIVEFDPSLQSEGQYISLSHCWGTSTHFVATTANIEMLKKSLPIELLPATFRDAITATRNLGFRFLWIDSLCILQDSPEDWQANCSLMSTIYENSIVTIGALWAKDSSDELFADREAICLRNKYGPIGITGPSNSKEPSSISIRHTPDSFKEAARASKLHKRAWVLQERILSPAILYYWNSEMYFEYRSGCSAESRPDLLMHNFGHLKNMPNEMYRNLSLGSGGYYTAWYAFVEFYTRKELTFRSDRLPAILGIATRFASLLEFTQMAGLWFEDLHKGLIWKGFGYGITRERHATENWSTAPSWSWFAASFPVRYPYAGGWWVGSVCCIYSPPDAEILDAHVSNPNHLGASYNCGEASLMYPSWLSLVYPSWLGN